MYLEKELTTVLGASEAVRTIRTAQKATLLQCAHGQMLSH